MPDIKELALLAFKKEALKKIVFSRPKSKDDPIKVSARLCAHRGQKILAAEYSLSGNTVSQKNLREGEICDFLSSLLEKYNQVNLLTTLGDAELKSGKSGTVTLGADKLYRKLTGDPPAFESAIEELENKKKYILSGSEEFLRALGISDKNGRVHDKKQAKFRQINKFLEYTEDIYPHLPKDGKITVFDLCCGKSYLSFAVYYYFTAIKSRDVYMLGVDLKRDVIEFCNSIAKESGFSGMHFVCDDITNTPSDVKPDLVISLHACDVATDIVLDTAVKLSAKVILSTPCCQRELSTKIDAPELRFVTKYPKLKRTLCDALTDALRLERLEALGYDACATELVDPEDTPKNTLIRAIRRDGGTKKSQDAYNELLKFLMRSEYENYIGLIKGQTDG